MGVERLISMKGRKRQADKERRDQLRSNSVARSNVPGLAVAYVRAALTAAGANRRACRASALAFHVATTLVRPSILLSYVSPCDSCTSKPNPHRFDAYSTDSATSVDFRGLGPNSQSANETYAGGRGNTASRPEAANGGVHDEKTEWWGRKGESVRF